MNRREFMSLGGSALAMAGTALVPAQVPARQRTERRPHILLLIADQMRADCLGIAGNAAIRTPHLDRLAREGALFRCAYSSTPSCTPARAGLLTGLSPWRHGVLGYGRIGGRYPSDMPRLLQEGGYSTAVIGKCHFFPQRNVHGFARSMLDESGRVETPDFRSDYRSWFWSVAPTTNPDQTGLLWNDCRGAPYALPESMHPTRWTGDMAASFIRSYADPQPFFLKVSFERPHSPYDPPRRWWDTYADASIPEAFVGEWAQRFAPRSGPDFQVWHGDLGAAQVRQSRRGYYGNVSFVDEQIGRIVDALKSSDLLEDTLIVFLSDHGDMLGDQHLWRKSYAYESSSRIAMLMRWPRGLVGAARGQLRDEPVELRDVLPTLLDAARLSPPVALDGTSLLALCRGGAEWREYIDLEHDVCYDPSNHWNALSDGKAKYIFHAQHATEQLFDLRSDPHELRDLARTPGSGEALSMWRARMVAHLRERGSAFVQNGRLMARPERCLYSPNYPGQVADYPVVPG